MLSQGIFLLLVAACAAVPSSIVRPCNSNSCVARNLAKQSRCNPRVRGSVPSRYTLDSFLFHTPYFNATYIDNDLTIENHDKCFISQFYYNLHSKRMVLALDCPGLRLSSTRTVIQHHSLREDVVYDYSYEGTYPLVRVTTSTAVPIDLCNSFNYADVAIMPYYNVNPNNRQTANFLTQDERYLDVFERESFFYRANLLMRFYVNSILCDFGCDY